MPSVTNQIIEVKDSAGNMNKLLLFIDSNSYVDKSIKAVLDWNYDVIHQAQVDWAKAEIARLSEKAGYPGRTCLDTVAFMHIPVGEFQQAYLDLEGNGFADTEDAQFIKGVWDEKIDETLNLRIWYGGCTQYKDAPEEADTFFETLGPEGVGALEAVFCGHDHTNNFIANVDGVDLIQTPGVSYVSYHNNLYQGARVIEISEDDPWTYRTYCLTANELAAEDGSHLADGGERSNFSYRLSAFFFKVFEFFRKYLIGQLAA